MAWKPIAPSENLIQRPNRKASKPLEQFKAGKLELELDGQKLHGRFYLIKTHSPKENAWLLVKGKDRWASKEDILQQDRSVLSGKKIEELSARS